MAVLRHKSNKKGGWESIPTLNTYERWTYGSYLCWKNKCICGNCSEKRICDSIKPMGFIPYGLKPMKFAVMMLKQKFGTEGLDEKFSKYYECE